MSVCNAALFYCRVSKLITYAQDDSNNKNKTTDGERGIDGGRKVKERQRKEDVRHSARTRDSRYLESLSCGLAATCHTAC